MSTAQNLPAVVTSQTMELTGFVLHEDSLTRVNDLALETLSSRDEDTSLPIRSSYAATFTGGIRFQSPSLNALLEHLDSEQRQMRTLEIEYFQSRRAGISLLFRPTGEVRISGFSPEPEFQFNIDRLKNEIMGSRPEYPAPIRIFIFSNRARRIISTLVPLLSAFVLANTIYYFYALKVGINLDPDILMTQDRYFKAIESALKSKSIEEKLNALLLSQLRNFTNVTDILKRVRVWLLYGTFLLVCCVTMLWLHKVLSELYPRAYFALRRQRQRLETMERKRELWTVGIIVGFIVNILAGLVLAIFI